MKKYFIFTLWALIISGNALASEPLDTLTDKSVIMTSDEMPVQNFEPFILATLGSLNYYGPAPSMNSYDDILFTYAARDPYGLRLLTHDEVKMPDLEILYESYGYNKAVKHRIDYFFFFFKKIF